MLEDQADFIYIMGVQAKWNIWDWNKSKREKQINNILKDKINTQKEIFDKNIKISIIKEEANIQKLNNMIDSDLQIINLRERISKTKYAQFKNGIITSSEYMLDLNAETQAKINKQMHDLQRIKAIINYNTIIGKN
ncbi:MAG: TolC family protein, partial [Bacteroidales bacterium]|nr:TolC family protein [Bacteroidales bacterium]MBN2758259.1 TolC family protein [Bacteroidales bacterium]